VDTLSFLLPIPRTPTHRQMENVDWSKQIMEVPGRKTKKVGIEPKPKPKQREDQRFIRPGVGGGMEPTW
jgi:hypothetical protein